MFMSVEMSAASLERQNETFEQTFASVEDMISDNSDNILRMTAQAETLENMIGDLRALLA